jgi:hypothetical protein
MPRRPIKVTVSVDDKSGQTVSVQAGDTIADINHRFVLNYHENLAGKNHANIVINPNGLLTSSNADTTSGVSQLAQNVAKAVGSITPLLRLGELPPQAPTPTQICKPGQTYNLLIFPEMSKSGTVCNYSVLATPLWDKSPGNASDNERVAKAGSANPGIFYKHDLPYLVAVVDVSDPKNAVTPSFFTATSPDESAINFVPIPQTLFANSSGNFTFSNGTLASADQSSDGELVGLASLPADILSAYFGAVGNIFQAFSSTSQQQTNAITQQQSLSLEKIKRQVCQAAIENNPVVGKTGDAAQTAYSNIKNACS